MCLRSVICSAAQRAGQSLRRPLPFSMNVSWTEKSVAIGGEAAAPAAMVVKLFECPVLT